VGCFSSQGSTQLEWKIWPQAGNCRRTSDSSYSNKQIGHLHRSNPNKKTEERSEEKSPRKKKEITSHHSSGELREKKKRKICNNNVQSTHWLFSSSCIDPSFMSSFAFTVGKVSNTSFWIPNCSFYNTRKTQIPIRQEAARSLIRNKSALTVTRSTNFSTILTRERGESGEY
jgi:hypothetical protein